MRSPFIPLVVAGLTTAGAVVLPVLARELEPESVRESVDLALNSAIEAETLPAESLPSESLPEAEPVPAPVKAEPPKPPAPAVVSVSTGQASWYGPGFFGNRTASGEVLRPGTLTAAHRTLPFGTKVRVTNLWNGRSAVVRINDRGPFHGARVIDLAHGAANQLGLVASGVAKVKLEVLR
ncbi:septal ring lytic transglycosylase RlpA family protein [Synechococcus sp. WH 8101]|jgi:rare lipoprotein A|uniref:septal ring lytic transglycosylase RlpA family protein n=1 Tax=Synechococcus sp. WH 8101 TaxID=59932 RepID=UPI0010232732|nr:septal ring lytic transglycosylase RlpA family protein [Synechococcus sp. WH 8101]QBE68119.1 septal ring lytic transglycosylase RlpA family protein [Synechococcus sp. WH 8101]QNI44329.1 rare lipoA family protein [Synechococcus sp. WH 8101]